MSDTQLTSLSTIAWIVATTTLFILLAHWSAGGTWGFSAAVARGLIGWAGRSGSIAGEWPSDDELGPIGSPEIDRLWAGEPAPGAGIAATMDRPRTLEPTAELEELGARRLP